MDLEDEIEADFIVFYKIYDIFNDDNLDGPRFVRLASQLPNYDGAVRRRLEREIQQDSEGSGVTASADEFSPGQTMSMNEALSRSKGGDMAVLESLSRDSVKDGLGDLFEYETA